jgi:hypothetical protein
MNFNSLSLSTMVMPDPRVTLAFVLLVSPPVATFFAVVEAPTPLSGRLIWRNLLPAPTHVRSAPVDPPRTTTVRA